MSQDVTEILAYDGELGINLLIRQEHRFVAGEDFTMSNRCATERLNRRRAQLQRRE